MHTLLIDLPRLTLACARRVAIGSSAFALVVGAAVTGRSRAASLNPGLAGRTGANSEVVKRWTQSTMLLLARMAPPVRTSPFATSSESSMRPLRAERRRRNKNPTWLNAWEFHEADQPDFTSRCSQLLSCRVLGEILNSVTAYSGTTNTGTD